MRKLFSIFVDHPGVVTAAIMSLVAVQYTLSLIASPSFSPGYLLLNSASSDTANAAMQIALGTAAVSAMVGGFAGVVVVFGLSSDDERFREVRQKASSSLRRNWRSVVSTPLLAAFGAIVAAWLAAVSLEPSALWVLELCILLAAHGAVRLVVVLFELVKVVHAADEAYASAASNGEPDPDEFLD